MDEREIGQLLRHDFSEGTEAFREALLQKCLSTLDKDDEDGLPIDDEDLEMLAAAGDHALGLVFPFED